MTDTFRIYGSELSPYSVKVRSYCRYKNIPNEWIVRTNAHDEVFKRHAKLPLIPLVVTPEDQGMQDSTPIIERLEAAWPVPGVHPEDPVAAFASVLLEEYGDEWVNKPMFHYRWHYEADQVATAERIAASRFGLTGAALAEAAATIRERMTGRLHFVGSSAETREVIEGSLHRLLALLETHLDGRDYLFGGRPAFGDFGLFAQLHQCSTDPTAGALMRQAAPRTLAWCQRMLDPQAAAPFENWDGVKATLLPLLAQEVGAVFLPWSAANARALEAGEATMSVQLRGQPFSQDAQKYHARSLQVLRQKYAGLADRASVDAALADTGCLAYLA